MEVCNFVKNALLEIFQYFTNKLTTSPVVKGSLTGREVYVWLSSNIFINIIFIFRWFGKLATCSPPSKTTLKLKKNLCNFCLNSVPWESKRSLFLKHCQNHLVADCDLWNFFQLRNLYFSLTGAIRFMASNINIYIVEKWLDFVLEKNR